MGGLEVHTDGVNIELSAKWREGICSSVDLSFRL